MSSSFSASNIAIVGMSALFPGARNLQSYWQNILNKVSAITSAPDDWASPYYDPNSKENDRIYTRKGGFLHDLAEFDPTEFGIMPSSVDGGEPDHFLGLKLAWEALNDAGYINRSFNREKTGIILGRGTYINRGYNTLLQHGQILDQTISLISQLCPTLSPATLTTLRQSLKSSLPPFTAEMAPGLVPNVITGRIANRLDLMGPNYIVDAACASSLIAVELGIKELLSGRCDMILTGGVHASTPPQINMIFCQLGALARDAINPFDEAATGTLLGEGVGILVLKRLCDAEKDGDRIYAVIKGIGSSSDGKALGLLAPRLDGEVLALEQVYHASGVDPKSIGLIEAHGTGIPLGDRTEIQSLTQVFGQRQEQLPYCALGSVKSMIGHCIPAAGAASLIKTALALYHKVLPPTLCNTINPALEIEKTPFYLNTEARPWIHGSSSAPRRAGINAFGFGGINAHAVLEEYPSSAIAPTKTLYKQWPTELLLFSENEQEDLVLLIHEVQLLIERVPQTELADLAYTLANRPLAAHRLVLIAKDCADLKVKLGQAIKELQDKKRTDFKSRNGIYYSVISSTPQPRKIAFLFPGEGSQYPNMVADLCLYFPQVRAWFDILDATFAERRICPPSHLIFPPPSSLAETERQTATKQLFNMDVASETVFTASMALYELLCLLKVPCDVMVGHSTGENAALIASGTIQLVSHEQLMEKMRYLNQIYLDLELANGIPKGSLITIGGVSPDTLNQLLADYEGKLYLAMDNCPNQVVLFGSESDIDSAVTRLKAEGGICTRLPFDRAYHTPLFAEVSEAFRAFYNSLDIQPAQIPLYSCATASPFTTDSPDAVRELATQQWSTRVRFRETITQLYQEGVNTFIEVGPSANLTSFVTDTLTGNNYLAIATNSKRRSGLNQILHLLAQLVTNDIPINLLPLYSHREVTLLDINSILHGNVSIKKQAVLELNMPRMSLKPEVVTSVQNELQSQLAHSTLTESVTQMPYSVSNELEIFNGAEAEPKITPLTQEKITTSTASLNSSNGIELATQTQTQTISTISIAHHADATNNLDGSCEIAAFDQEQSFGDSEFSSVVASPEPVSTYFHLVQDVSNSTDASGASLVAAHFNLMQEFLASQGRITTAILSHLDGTDTFPLSLVNTFDVATEQSVSLSTKTASWPLLGKILEQDGEQLHCERCFEMNQDIFLYDHTLGGQVSSRHPELFPLPVIPFTISMEILAEAAVCLLGNDKTVIGLRDLRGYRWLSLDQGSLTVNIKAKILPSNTNFYEVKVQIFQASSGTTTLSHLVFEGVVMLSHCFPEAPVPLNFTLSQIVASRWKDAELYSTGMFHGPRFQGVKHICCWGPEGIEAELQTIAVNNFFRYAHEPLFQIDAGLLDAAGQLVGYWVSEQFGTDFNVFPFQVRSFQQYAPPLPPGVPILCRGLMRFTEKEQTEASFDFLDPTGRVIARLQGWQDRYFSVPHHYYQCRLHPQTAYLSRSWMQAETGLICRRIYPFPDHFLDDSWSIWKRVLAHLTLSYAERDVWYALPDNNSLKTDWLLSRIAAKDAVRQWAKLQFNLELAPIDIEIRSNDLGNSFVYCPELAAIAPVPNISMTHSAGHVVAALAKQGTLAGLDLKQLNILEVEDLLVNVLTHEEQQWIQQSTVERNSLVVQLCCVKAAAAKALGLELRLASKQLQIQAYSLSEGFANVIYANQILPVKVWLLDQEVLAVCQYSQ